MTNAELLDNVIKNNLISTRFQPVVNLKNARVIGYEALSRGPFGTPLYSPATMIQTAKECGRLEELENLFRISTLERAVSLKLNKLLFMNVEPDCGDPFNINGCLSIGFLKRMGLSPHSLVIEVTERCAVSDCSLFYKAMLQKKSAGYSFAIDDMGASYSNFSAVSAVSPKYIKIDASIIHKIGSDGFKQSIVKSFVLLCSLTNIRLIAEGIETADELKTLIKLGVYAGQGYFIARPGAAFADISENAMAVIRAEDSKAADEKYTEVIGDICERPASFNSSARCVEVKRFLDKNSAEGVAVTDNGEVLGLVMKNRLDAMLSSQYGYSLFADKPVSRLTDKSCIVTDYYTPVKSVSDMVLSRQRENIYDNVIVTKGGEYEGLVTVINLLKYSMEMECRIALERNPLTRLPGNLQINQQLYKAIQSKKRSCVLYIDLNNFKAYNDIYGFKQGDSMILAAADSITSVLDANGHFEHFTGHIGGDDFVIFADCNASVAAAICRAIIERFDRAVVDLYSDEDLENGYIVAPDRNNVLRTFPLTQMSISGVAGSLNIFNTPEDISSYISPIKKAAKAASEASQKSAYIIDLLESGKQLSNID